MLVSARPSAIPALLAVFLALLASPASTAEGILMRITVENVSSHFEARMVGRFAELVRERAGEALVVEYYSDAKLFRDADAVAALSRGEVEMAVPGVWHFDKEAPDSAAFMLPSVYGAPVEVLRGLADGPLGTLVEAMLSRSLGVRVLGDWLDLGYAQLFSTRPLRSVEELAGLSTRVAGGRCNAERMRAFGAVPVSISLMDLPAYLDAGVVDAVLTTFETVDSAGLDAHGLVFALEDREYYPFYIPLVSNDFWERLSPELRRIVAEAWAELLPEGREEAERSQAAALERLVSRGMTVFRPSEAEVERTRRRLLARESEMAGRLGISAEALSLLRSGLAGMR